MSGTRTVETRPDCAISPGTARRLAPVLRSLLESAGGFTLDVRETRLLDSGIAVCADPGATLTFAADRWDDDRIGDWLTDASCGHRHDDVHVGGWLEPLARRVWLDVVHVFDARHRNRAVALARRHGQRAVFDLGRGALVPLPLEGVLG